MILDCLSSMVSVDFPTAKRYPTINANNVFLAIFSTRKEIASLLILTVQSEIVLTNAFSASRATGSTKMECVLP